MGSLTENSAFRYAHNSLVNPNIPCKLPLRQLQLGELIFVRGYVPPKSLTFSINLQFDIGNGKADNILHISARFKEKVIVRNSQFGGKWGAEERKNGMGSLKQNQYFECCILVHQDYFKVAFNKQHFCTFRHRAPYGSINQLHVTGSVQLDSICTQQPPINNRLLTAKAMPTISQPHQAAHNEGGDATRKQKPYHAYHLTVPFHALLQKGLKSGTVIYICGQPTKLCKSFCVTLKSSTASGDRDIVYRVRATFDDRSVRCSSDTVPEVSMQQMLSFPFQRSVHFDMVIVCERETFNVAVNNSHLIQLRDFKSEFKLDRIRRLEVAGELKLQHIRMQ